MVKPDVKLLEMLGHLKFGDLLVDTLVLYKFTGGPGPNKIFIFRLGGERRVVKCLICTCPLSSTLV
jgi:hypothetical protein